MGRLYVGYIGEPVVKTALEELGSARKGCRQQVMLLKPGTRVPQGSVYLHTAPLRVLRPKGGCVRLLDQSKEYDRVLFSDDPLVQGADFQVLVWGDCAGGKNWKCVRSLPRHIEHVIQLRKAA